MGVGFEYAIRNFRSTKYNFGDVALIQKGIVR